MLGKLIKHEFRATGRLMAPLFGALLLLAVFSRVANQILQQVPNPTRVLYIVSVLLAIVYVLAGLGVMVFSTVLMIKRFHQNFLTDEGYLMFTLPVGVHSLLWSKLITAALFFLFTFAAELLALAIVIWQGGVSTELYNNFISGLRELGSYYTGNGIAIALETFAMLFVSLLVTCLLFYAPMSIGYSFANHKGLLSVSSILSFTIGNPVSLKLLSAVFPSSCFPSADVLEDAVFSPCSCSADDAQAIQAEVIAQ